MTAELGDPQGDSVALPRHPGRRSAVERQPGWTRGLKPRAGGTTRAGIWSRQRSPGSGLGLPGSAVSRVGGVQGGPSAMREEEAGVPSASARRRDFFVLGTPGCVPSSARCFRVRCARSVDRVLVNVSRGAEGGRPTPAADRCRTEASTGSMASFPECVRRGVYSSGSGNTCSSSASSPPGSRVCVHGFESPRGGSAVTSVWRMAKSGRWGWGGRGSSGRTPFERCRARGVGPGRPRRGLLQWLT